MNFDDLLTQHCKLLTEQPSKKPITVLVNLYELTPSLAGTKNIGIGIFHSATEIMGYEIAYGGTKSPGTGLFFANPLTVPPPAKFYKQIKLGVSKYNTQQIADILLQNRSIFSGQSYNIISKNCNHFTDWFVQKLSGVKLPEYVNRIAKIGRKMGCFGVEGVLGFGDGIGPEIGRLGNE